ncbi:MAG: U32 family peptidase [Ruminococcus sp.]|nr:U32 family peptidase [Ruminococcus sp.]
MAEILAPCGSPEVLMAALRAGCDAVYLGGESFSARQNAVNFTDRQIEEAVFLCHKRGVKVYRTINTLVFDEQMDELMRAVEHSARCGIDGLITQDLALVQIVRKCCPGLPVHASTQMTIHTAQGVKTAMELGFSRTVVARELPIEKIGELCSLGTEIEVFVHGAMCMSVSGQCYMSALVGSRSANRGLCAQACRLPCNAGGTRGERYDLSLKDMSYLDSIDSLVKAGAASLKIEGRMKRPEYTAMAVASLKNALEGRDYDRETLAGVFSRGGFTDGYLYGRRGHEMFGRRQKDDVDASAAALPKIHELYRCEEKRDRISFELNAAAGTGVSLKAADSLGSEVTVFGAAAQKARNKPTDLESVTRQLKKLGDTVYSLGEVSGSIEEGLFISPAQLNSMRRQACEELDRVRAERNTRTVPFDRSALDLDEGPGTEPAAGKKPGLRVFISSLQQLKLLEDLDSPAEFFAVPLGMFGQAAKLCPADRLAAAMPRFTFDEEKQTGELRSAVSAGCKRIIAQNIAHIRTAGELDLECHGGAGLNITNSLALKQAAELGLSDCTVSFEIRAAQIRKLKKHLPIGIAAYGRLPLMLTVNCPIAQAVGCKNCTKYVSDRTGRIFPVKCSKKEGYVEILNSEVLYLADRLDEFVGTDFFDIYLTDEGPQEARKIIESYAGLSAGAKPSQLTRGLYFRGVL